MSKFFPASSRHVKDREFLELKHGSMTMLEYVAKFTELACFGDDYVTTDMVKVRKFEDGLKLSIQGKIVGFFLQNMDSMVKTAMAIEKEIDDVRSIRDTGVGDKRKEGQVSSNSGKKHKTFIPRGFRGKGHDYQGQGHIRAPIQLGPMTCFHCH